MAIKTYRVYISGKIGTRHVNVILHDMLEDLGFASGGGAEGTSFDDQTPVVRNMHRGIDESYFDVDFPNADQNVDYIAKVESMKRYIVDNSVQYQDITTEPPKDM